MKSLLILILILLTGCSVYSPDAGHEVVLVDKPMFFGHGGVEDTPIHTGRSYGALTTDGIDVYMQPQKFSVEMPDTMTQDGVPVTFHVMMTLQVIDSVALVRNFGPDWYANNLEKPFEKMVRQAVRMRGMNEVAISASAIDAIDNEVGNAVEGFIHDKGLPVKLVTLTVGRANPPDAIKNQRIETAAQEQRVQTEKQIALAEDQRKAAETARAAADNAYRQAIGLTPEQYIQLKRIEMETKVCDGGKCTFIENGSALPAVNLK